MYNLRYHIASLAAVFIALALGLILGGLAVGGGALEGQQGALVDGLRKEFSSLRSHNEVLGAQNAMLSQYAKERNDEWVASRLSGRTVVVLSGPGRTDGLQVAVRDLEGAGADVAVITMSQPEFGVAQPELRSRIESLTGVREDLAASVAASLATEWITSAPVRPLTRLLEDAGVLAVDGLGDGVAVSGLVDVAARDGKSDAVAIRLAKAFSDAGGSAVGAQTTDAGTGVAASASDAGISGFDTLGTEVGRYTLIALMSGAKPGYYGHAAGTDAPFPERPAR